MSETLNQLAARLKQYFGDKVRSTRICTDQLTIELPPEHLLHVCQMLCHDSDFSFEQLIDLCGVDYSAYGQADWQTNKASTAGFSRGVSPAVEIVDSLPAEFSRFAVVYHLLSLKHNQRLRIRVFTDGEPPAVPSVIDVWASADWYEREAFDLFGIVFEGHPDLRRILTDYGFVGHPFRKDFPLEGKVEVRYDPEQKRVVYQPVTIENRVLVPRVIRADSCGREASATASKESDHA